MDMNDISSIARARTSQWRALATLGALAAGLNLGGCNEEAAPAAAAAPAQTAPAPVPQQAAHREPAKTAHSNAAPAKTAEAPKKAAPVCADCATVASITSEEREGSGSGAGAIAGGLLGAALGHQVGQGTGKDLATVAGAIGGGFAGNAVEKKMKKTTVYQIALRMDDGSQRSMELADVGNLKAGARVRVDGANLQALPAGK
jgi:outer membrane lipoprotein SlyB